MNDLGDYVFDMDCSPLQSRLDICANRFQNNQNVSWIELWVEVRARICRPGAGVRNELFKIYPSLE